MRPVRRVSGRGGLEMPPLGLGTWRMGERASRRKREVAAIRLGIELGMSLVDTAEIYGDAEEVVAEAIAGRREEVFLVSKVLPENASFAGTIAACEKSLGRLKTDRLDLYLLHWQGPHPLEETLEAFERLKEEGKVRHYGVSNFDAQAMDRAERLAPGKIAVNQVLYNLRSRGPEWRLLSWCEAHGVAVMAYSPLDQGRLKGKGALKSVAKRHGVRPEAVAIAWTLRHPFLASIPKASELEHVHVNRTALDVRLSDDDLTALDSDFPPPKRERPLEII